MASYLYNDWNQQKLFPVGSQARLDRLDLHISEVQGAFATGDYAINQRSFSKGSILGYLNQLYALRKLVSEQTDLTTGTRLGFTSGRAILDTGDTTQGGSLEP